MSKMHVFIDATYRERAIQAAGGTWKVSKWLNSVVLPAFFAAAHGVEALRALEREIAELRGENRALYRALELARHAPGPPTPEEPDYASNHTPHEPVESPILRRAG
jgi:hypothetical protein